MEDSVKITVLADEMGLSHKTLYNWINDGRLEVVRRGFVSRTQAWEVWEHMQQKRVEISYFLSAYGINRGANGQFVSGSARE